MKIDLTGREIELLMMCVGTNIETIKRRRDAAEPMNADMIEELFDLETDLREAVNRQDDDWGDAETHMFNAGAEASACVRQAKAGVLKSWAQERRSQMMESRAADRRQELLEGAAPSSLTIEQSTPTKVQLHDLWLVPANDPIDW